MHIPFRISISQQIYLFNYLMLHDTSGTVRECIYDDMYSYAVKIADGLVQDDQFLPILYELDDRSEWTDWKMWAKANPALGTIKKLEDLTAKVERAKNSPSDLSGILCKDFNIRDTVAGMWLTFDDVNNETTYDIEELRNCYAVSGADFICHNRPFMRKPARYETGQRQKIPAANVFSAGRIAGAAR